MATDRDLSLHAAVRAIRKAAHVLGDPDLSGTTVFSTCEPCPLCSAFAAWANVTTIAFGAPVRPDRADQNFDWGQSGQVWPMGTACENEGHG